jgi:oligoribonuclease (3'-5' exoribonuclease)
MDDLFHYRSLDVSNLHHAFRMAGYPLGEKLLRKPSNHRAVDDCLQTLEDWKHIVNTIAMLPA